MRSYKIVIFILILVTGTSLLAYSNNDESAYSLYVNNTLIDTKYPILNIEGTIAVPMNSLFDYFGAQLYFYQATNIMTSYRLNTYVKVDLDHMTYYINGKSQNFTMHPTNINGNIYVPIDLLIKSFDFSKIETSNKNEIHLTANNIIQYKNYDNIPYRQVSLNDDGIRYSIPLYWDKLDTNTYGYSTSYGNNSMNFTSRMLNENIDINYVIETYKEHLKMQYRDEIIIGDLKQKFYNYLTSNVLYLTVNVNVNPSKQIIHFIESDDKVYIVSFTYTDGISETYINNIFDTIMNSFYIDEKSVDTTLEHYIEYARARELGLHINGDIYSNMATENSFYIDGYFESDELVDSLIITVSRENQQLEFFVPVQNNSFYEKIYTPFGLGKHNIKVEKITAEEKIIFTDQSDPQFSDTTNDLLLKFSVVNLNQDSIRYKIPTKYVQSEDDFIKSMGQSLSYNFHTSYSKVKNIFNYVVENVDVLISHEAVYSAKDVYTELKGTKKEISLYLVALLRTQDIPAKIIEGKNEYTRHIWTEAFINGEWIIIDPVGDSLIFEDIKLDVKTILTPDFNASSSKYLIRYPEQSILEY